LQVAAINGKVAVLLIAIILLPVILLPSHLVLIIVVIAVGVHLNAQNVHPPPQQLLQPPLFHIALAFNVDSIRLQTATMHVMNGRTAFNLLALQADV
jgi:hypothetical protein